MQLVRPASGPPGFSCNRRHGIEQVLERLAVVGVGASQQEGERDAAPVSDEVPLGACLAAVRRVRPGSGTPLFAAMDALSTQARVQSMRSDWRRRRSNSRCGIVTLFDGRTSLTAGRSSRDVTPPSGHTFPAARSGRPCRANGGTVRRASGAAVDGSGHRSSRVPRGTAVLAQVT